MPGHDERLIQKRVPYWYVRRFSFIILVDRIFTSFVGSAFTSIFGPRAKSTAISCLYHQRHAS
jgi:hypothetical protein